MISVAMRYSLTEFDGIPRTDHPSENTLTLNVTHSQLTDLEPVYTNLIAIAPSRVQEGKHRRGKTDEGGFDVELDTAKEVVFQHKAPIGTVTHNDQLWLKYKVDMEQVGALTSEYSIGQAFLALPATPQRDEVPHALALSVFIDVHIISAYSKDPPPADADTTGKIYVEYKPEIEENVTDTNDLKSLSRDHMPAVKGKYNTTKWGMPGPAYYDLTLLSFSSGSITSAIVWPPLAKHLRECDWGVLIRGEERDPSYPRFEYWHDYSPISDDLDVAPPYVDRLARRKYVSEMIDYARDAGEIDESHLQTLAEDVVSRREYAVQNGWISVEDQPTEDTLGLEELTNTEAVEEELRPYFNRFTDGTPSSIKRTQRSDRFIFEGGTKADRVLTIPW